MAKDPAFLFYSSDFLTGTMTMTDEQVGRYIRLLCLQHQKGILTEKDMMFICKSKDDDIFGKFLKNASGYFNQRLREEAEKRKNYTESRRQSRLKCDEDNVRIYLLKDLDTGLIKIGSSVNPLRRYNEITKQAESVQGASKNRNYKLIWYSEPVLRKIEKELHDLFDEFNSVGEWFKLNQDNINKLKQIVCGTYEKHTNQRMENENVNEDININNININKSNFKKPTLEEITAYCLERQNKIRPQVFLDYYTSNGWRVGKNPMKDWKAAIRTWEKNNFEGSNGNGSYQRGYKRNQERELPPDIAEAADARARKWHEAKKAATGKT